MGSHKRGCKIQAQQQTWTCHGPQKSSLTQPISRSQCTEGCSHEGLKRRHATKHQCSVLNRSLSAAPCEAWSYRSRGRSNGLLVASAAPGTGAIPPKPPAARAPLAEDGPPSFSTPRALLHTGGVFMKFTRVFETVANVILTAFMQSLCIRSWLRASRGKSRSCNTEPSKTASRGNA